MSSWPQIFMGEFFTLLSYDFFGIGGKFSTETPRCSLHAMGVFLKSTTRGQCCHSLARCPRPPPLPGARELSAVSSAYSILCYYFLIYKALFLSRYLSLCPVSENLAEAIRNKKYKPLKAQGSGQIGVFKWLYAKQTGGGDNKSGDPDQNSTVIRVQR